jgi:hypothetical protein
MKWIKDIINRDRVMGKIEFRERTKERTREREREQDREGGAGGKGWICISITVVENPTWVLSPRILLMLRLTHLDSASSRGFSKPVSDVV